MEPTIADEMRGQWHKVVGALVAKGAGEVRLTVADFAAIEGKTVVVSHAEGGRVLVVRVMDAAEAERVEAAYQAAARRRSRAPAPAAGRGADRMIALRPNPIPPAVADLDGTPARVDRRAGFFLADPCGGEPCGEARSSESMSKGCPGSERAAGAFSLATEHNRGSVAPDAFFFPDSAPRPAGPRCAAATFSCVEAEDQ